MKQLFIFGVVVLVMLTLWSYMHKPEFPVAAEPAVNFTAEFDVYTEGVKRVFTSPMYHDLSRDVYITGANPNTVHVRKSGITWKDFFATLPMRLTDTCLVTGTGEKFCNGEQGFLKFSLQGKPVKNFLELEIHKGDKALIQFD